jgi:hypothetical protein
MDPYLESDFLWPVFHHQLITSLYQMLVPGLVDRYKARVGKRHYTTEQALFTSVVHEEHREEFIEIRNRGASRLVTLIEIVSPGNRTTAAGRDAYLAKRREGRAGGANLVEIDLVLQGHPTLDFSREGLPDWDYAVTVTRANQPDRFEIYKATIREHLPRFRLPLSGDDRDTVIDLHAVFTRAFDQGDFADQIDYHRDPTTIIDDDDRRWLDQLLRDHKLR